MRTMLSLPRVVGLFSLVCASITVGCRTDEVNSPSLTPTPTGIRWTSCINGTTTVAWLAIQDGTGPWRRITEMDKTFAFRLDSNRAGVAYVTVGATPSEYAETSIRFYTAHELKNIRPLCAGLIGLRGREIRGTVAGLGPLERADIALAQSTTSADWSTGVGISSFALQNIEGGPADLIAVRRVSCQNPPTCAAATGMIIRRGIDPPIGSVLPVLDFADTRETFQLLPNSLTIQGLAAGESGLVVEAFSTPRTSAIVRLMDDTKLNATGPTARITYYAVPDDRLSTGDVHRISVYAASADAGHETLVEMHSAADASITMVSEFPPVTIVTTRRSGFATVSTEVAQTGGSRTWLAEFDQRDVNISIRVSAGYAGRGSVGLSIPNFARVSGWSSSWDCALGPSSGGPSLRWTGM